MKVSVNLYLVEDAFGNKASATCEESCDTIQICGMQNNSMEEVYFESDAYHLQGWCNENNIKYKHVKKEYDFDELWNSELLPTVEK